jgi:uncharacterized membrane protein YgdD (TMEM256/DUF423 family)
MDRFDSKVSNPLRSFSHFSLFLATMSLQYCILSQRSHNYKQRKRMMDSDQLRYIASFLGATGVGMGAAGAHGLQKTLAKNGMQSAWTVASTYHLLHAAAILGVAALCKAYENEQNSPSRQIVRAGQLIAAGTTMFSGSIYLLALGIGPKKILGPTTPIGGLLMIGGWAMLGLASSSSS